MGGTANKSPTLQKADFSALCSARKREKGAQGEEAKVGGERQRVWASCQRCVGVGIFEWQTRKWKWAIVHVEEEKLGMEPDHEDPDFFVPEVLVEEGGNREPHDEEGTTRK